MAQFLRRIAPAVLVGTAAVAVAGSAIGSGTEATVNAAASSGSGSGTLDGSTGTVPNDPNGGSVPQSSNQLEDWLNDLESEGDDDDQSGSQSYVAPTPTPTPTPSASSPTSGTNSSGATATSSCDVQEIVGPVVRTEWGPVQVAAKVSGGKVCAIRTIQTPTGDRKSIMINSRAVPALEQQVLAAGNAQIDGVSGATVTTVGYTTSLQAILDGA